VINWKVRYAGLFERCPELADPDRRILEVGSGCEGAGRYLKRTVIGIDRAFDRPIGSYLNPVRASILRLPFVSSAFEDVLCVDTLEHLPLRDRPRAIAELIRVASRRVIISGPAGGFAVWGDASYAGHIARGRRELPGWLGEHLHHGIPSLGDLLEMLADCGHPFTVHVTEGAIQHYSGLLADNYPFMSRFLDMHDRKFSVESPLGRAEGDVPYSYLLIIDVGGTKPTTTATLPAGANPAPHASRQKRLEIFAVGHRLDRLPEIAGIRRILAGTGEPGLDRHPGILRDNSGDSIADRNVDLSELTAIYWVWKNVTDLAGVGFCHYRRYFDFRSAGTRASRETRLKSSREVARHQASFTDHAVMAKVVDEGAIVVARSTEEGIANAEQYMIAHRADDYLAMLNYLFARYSQLRDQTIAHVRDDGFYGNNMFVMPWADFDRLCEFWFDCLFGLDRQLANKPAGYQSRVLAFLSERLLDIYVRWLRDCGREVVEYPLFFLEDSAFLDGARIG